MNKEFKNVLVLAPHTDDGELGCGATISKLIQNGSKVTYVAFSTADQSLPKGFQDGTLVNELKDAAKKLGIQKNDLLIYRFEVRKLNYSRQDVLEILIELRNKNNFDLVFLPSSHDIHQDHEVIAQEGLRAFKNTSILGYELIWNNISFNSECFIEVSMDNLNIKIDALKAYKSQSGKSYFSSDFITSLAKVRGTQIGVDYAECFEVMRLIL